jgi:hypothetical protein
MFDTILPNLIEGASSRVDTAVRVSSVLGLTQCSATVLGQLKSGLNLSMELIAQSQGSPSPLLSGPEAMDRLVEQLLPYIVQSIEDTTTVGGVLASCLLAV